MFKKYFLNIYNIHTIFFNIYKSIYFFNFLLVLPFLARFCAVLMNCAAFLSTTTLLTTFLLAIVSTTFLITLIL